MLSQAYYWSATEQNATNSWSHYLSNMSGVVRDTFDITRGYAVRCIKDVEIPEQTFNECGDSLLDERDEQFYQTIQIGDQCWMAENLNTESYQNNDPIPDGTGIGGD